MAVFGGIENRRPLGDIALLDLNEMLWTVPMVGGFWPSPRLSCGMSWGLSEEGKGLLLVIGGAERNLCRMELFSLEESPSEPRSLHVTKAEVPVVRASSIQSSIQSQPGSEQSRKQSQPSSEQSSKLAKLEAQLQAYTATVKELEEQKQQLEEQRQYEQQLSRDQQRQIKKKLDLLEQEVAHKEERLETSEELLDLLRQKETVLSQRADDLEDLVKKAETLLITLDFAFHEVIKTNQSVGFRTLSRDKQLTLEERRKQHSQGLTMTRGHYQETIMEQEALDSQIAELKF
jgi:predicted RNase H-like nuclease (RuvC/YqgF family)